MQRALVLGGTGDIGKEIVRHFLTMGFAVECLVRDVTKAHEIFEKVDARESLSLTPITYEDEGLLEESLKPLLPAQVLISCVGSIHYAPAQYEKAEQIRALFESNFMTNVMFLRLALRRKLLRPGASIIFISSLSAHLATQGTSAYAASKAALSTYARVLARELARQKIRVNCISPGTLETSSVVDKIQLTPELLADLQSKYPLGLGQAKDVAYLAEFLASEKARWLTGQDFILDGGYSITL